MYFKLRCSNPRELWIEKFPKVPIFQTTAYHVGSGRLQVSLLNMPINSVLIPIFNTHQRHPCAKKILLPLYWFVNPNPIQKNYTSHFSNFILPIYLFNTVCSTTILGEKAVWNPFLVQPPFYYYCYNVKCIYTIHDIQFMSAYCVFHVYLLSVSAGSLFNRIAVSHEIWISQGTYK